MEVASLLDTILASMKKSQTLLLLVLLDYVAATLYEDCGSVARIVRVDIEDCILPPCHVTRPDIQDVNITFSPIDVVQKFDATLDARIDGIHFPWPGPGGCKLLVDGECPLEANGTYLYHAVMPVLKEYPALSVYVTWIIRDNQGLNQVCISFPVIIS
ncbi:NPC intracellular cholesterol transporter 2-like [Homarus americanus]|uniref:NPC intracellular cholesterol transporter 2-like n=1 Tax=Homarus americanus TaxID=6706 RepID=UPI001C4681E0|nr:NPC intracellular cholesterol transporter 2-like [Homarus americanus]